MRNTGIGCRIAGGVFAAVVIFVWLVPFTSSGIDCGSYLFKAEVATRYFTSCDSSMSSRAWIGWIALAVSIGFSAIGHKLHTDANYELQQLNNQDQLRYQASRLPSAPDRPASLVDEIEKLTRLRDAGSISAEQFDAAMKRLSDSKP